MERILVFTLAVLQLVLNGCYAEERFTSTPPSIIYSRTGSQVFFNWTYETGDPLVTATVKNWYQSDKSGSVLGKMVMSQIHDGAPNTYKENFINRTTYVPNAGMIVRNVQISDEGYFVCRLLYSNGHSHEHMVQLVVTVPPKIGLALPNETVVMIHTLSVLSCQFDARPLPAIKWFLSGKEVNGSRYVINTTTIGTFSNSTRVLTTLLINRTTPNDNGLIQCIATLPNDNAMSETNHIVYYAPQNSKMTTNRVGNIGELGAQTVFSCTSQGNPTVFYQIYKGSTLLSNTTLGTYTINSTTFDNRGTYTCVSVNYLGEGPIATVNFTVNVSPRLQDYSGEKVTKKLGSAVTLHCTFFGQPSPNITWRKYGSPILSAVNITTEIISVIQNYTVVRSALKLNHAAKSDHGTYNCFAQNSAGLNDVNVTLDVQYSPEFSKTLPVNYTLLEEASKNQNWTCIAEGNPSLAINWHMSGAAVDAGYTITQQYQPIFNGVRLQSVITMVGVTRSKAGVLSCNATNSAGSVQSNSNVFVNYHPSTSYPLNAERFVVLGKRVTMTCKLHSQPLSNMHWEKNGVFIDNSTHSISVRHTQPSLFSTSLESNLTIAEAKKSDDAPYRCIATNSVGNLTQATYLKVLYMPELHVSLSKTSRVRDESGRYTMECTVRSNPAANFTWTKNGLTIQNSSEISIHAQYSNVTVKGSTLRTRLVFVNIQKKDYGNYSCIATNDVGSVTSEQHLIVTYKPYIVVSSLSVITVNETQAIKLFCEIRSSPGVTSLLWLVNGQPNRTANHIVSQSYTATSHRYSQVKLEIIITNASSVDNGVYACKAENSLGNVSKSISLVVNYRPVIERGVSPYAIEQESSQVSLTCVFDSIPESVVYWVFNGTVIQESAQMKIKTSNRTMISRVRTTTTLSIQNTRRDMHGYYGCHARNHQGARSSSGYIAVYYGPEFNSNLTGQLDVEEGANASFECQVEGHPTPDVWWKKNGVRILTGSSKHIVQETVVVSGNKTIRKSVIRFTNVTEHDTASYTCVANSSAGRKDATKLLNVLFIPKLLVQPYSRTVNQSQDVSIECKVAANPSVSRFLWTKDGISQPEASSVYRIPSAQEQSSGVYTCIAVNSLGQSQVLTINLLVNVPPTFTKPAECKANTTTMKIVCTCAGRGVPTPSVYWTKGNDNVKIGSGNVYEELIRAPSVNERYKCHLENILKRETGLVTFYYNVNKMSVWTVWGDCNSTCKVGLRTRIRTCNINPCSQHELIDYKNCTGACPIKELKQDEAWAIALYVLIPIIVVLLVILLLWLARSNRRKEEESPIIVPVYGNLSKPPSTRSMPTKRDIYLPQETFGTINSVYFEAADTPQREADTPLKEVDTSLFNEGEGEYQEEEQEIVLEEEFPLDSNTDEDAETISPRSFLHGTADDPDTPDKSSLQGASIDSPQAETPSSTNYDEVPYSFYNEMVTSL